MVWEIIRDLRIALVKVPLPLEVLKELLGKAAKLRLLFLAIGFEPITYALRIGWGAPDYRRRTSPQFSRRERVRRNDHAAGASEPLLRAIRAGPASGRLALPVFHQEQNARDESNDRINPRVRDVLENSERVQADDDQVDSDQEQSPI